ncbi:MAG: transglutaminase family protein [Acidaminococcaceae bacterium]|nr:transglutaminase family protein [Acidaminococcaceae bacterium]
MHRELSFYFDTVLNFSGPVTEHNFLLRCIPADTPEQKILSYTLTVFPDASAARIGKDSFGNFVRAGRVAEAHDSFRYTLQGMAYRDDSLRVPEEAAPFYRYASPLTQPTPELAEFFAAQSAAGWCVAQQQAQQFSENNVPALNALEKAKILCAKVHEHFTYTPGETNVMTTAGEAFAAAKGVCQDYAHVLIALCRMADIPSRYVSGLFTGEGASHAWVEIWMDGLWYGIDPTHDCPADEKYLKLCVGRDYADCPIERGVFSGWAEQTQNVFTKVTD